MRMVDLRARLGMTAEKSAASPPWRVGLKERETQARTQLRSNVWPEETMTGSAMIEPDSGQRNSTGIGKDRCWFRVGLWWRLSGGGGEELDGDLRKEIFHLCLLPLPIGEKWREGGEKIRENGAKDWDGKMAVD